MYYEKADGGNVELDRAETLCASKVFDVYDEYDIDDTAFIKMSESIRKVINKALEETTERQNRFLKKKMIKESNNDLFE